MMKKMAVMTGAGIIKLFFWIVVSETADVVSKEDDNNIN
jgi:hypothetical protein